MRNSGIIRWFFPLFAVAALLSYGGFLRGFAEEKPQKETFTVTKVIDGDTVEVRGGRRLRYEGIDCPETGSADFPADPLARSAKRINRKLADGKKIEVVFGSQRFDSYGRLLGFVFADGVNINLKIVEAGLATLFETEGQNPELMEELRSAERAARKARKGIWKGDGNFSPPRGNKRFIVPENRVADMTGGRVVVRAQIVETVRKRNGMVILKTGGGVNIPVFGRSVPNFTHFGINPGKFYNGKTVLITGRVSMYKGEPSIVVRHPLALYVEK